MFYNLILRQNVAVIRPAAEGLSDLEFEVGCRIRSQCNSRLSLENMLDNQQILNELEWKQFIRSLND